MVRQAAKARDSKQQLLPIPAQRQVMCLQSRRRRASALPRSSTRDQVVRELGAG
jgi:hypothetical protein